MPTYEYACKQCGEHLEVVQSFKDDALTVCPNCAGELRKVFGSVGIVFKGSGFYKTDSRSGSTASKKSEAPKKSESAKEGASTSSASESSNGSTPKSSGSNGSAPKSSDSSGSTSKSSDSKSAAAAS